MGVRLNMRCAAELWILRHPTQIMCARAVVQTDHFDGALAARAVDAANEQLEKLGKVQRTYSRMLQSGSPMTLDRLARPLIREDRRLWMLLSRASSSTERRSSGADRASARAASRRKLRRTGSRLPTMGGRQMSERRLRPRYGG